MNQCQVPGCEHSAEHEICRPHWRRVPGQIKRAVMALNGEKTPEYHALIQEAIDSVRNVRNVA